MIKFIFNFFVNRLAVIHQIHFIDTNHEVWNLQQRGNDRVAAGLF